MASPVALTIDAKNVDYARNYLTYERGTAMVFLANAALVSIRLAQYDYAEAKKDLEAENTTNAAAKLEVARRDMENSPSFCHQVVICIDGGEIEKFIKLVEEGKIATEPYAVRCFDPYLKGLKSEKATPEGAVKIAVELTRHCDDLERCVFMLKRETLRIREEIARLACQQKGINERKREREEDEKEEANKKQATAPTSPQTQPI